VFSLTQIIDLINLAGFHQGVGEMRPERSHSNGMFHVGTKDEAEHYQKEYGDVEFGDYQGELLYEDLLPPYDPVTEKILEARCPWPRSERRRVAARRTPPDPRARRGGPSRRVQVA
jgi:hypothetical protein